MNQKHSKVISFAGMVALSAPIFASGSISLPVTVRDFAASPQNLVGFPGVQYHPDFEYAVKSEKNLVLTMLGADNKPVFNTARVPASATINSQASFGSWYNNNPSYNTVVPIADLVASDPDNDGIFSYSNNSFFPITGLGFGNYSGGKNYHFTMELHTSFNYVPGTTFAFTGDDDLWVFVNKELVIDLGGVHGPQTGAIELDDLGLTAGGLYQFDLFFAERHTTQSNFSFDTSIAFVPTPNSVPEASGFTPALALLGVAGFTGLRRRRLAAQA